MTMRFHHWIIAGMAAALLHSAMAYAFFSEREPTQGAKAEGVGGLEISISMVAAAVGQVAQTEVQAPEQKENQKQAEPEPMIEEITPPEPEQVPAPEQVMEPEPVVEVQPAPMDVHKPVKKPVVSKPKPKPNVKQPEKTVPKPKEPRREKQLGVQSQGASTQSTLKANRSDRATRQGGGRVVGEIKPNYLTTLRHWLEKHKTYPKTAKRRRQEGVVILSFSITRDGQVPEFRIKQGSGYPSLDQETIAMLQRAVPLPKFPKDMEGDVLKISLPIQFALR